MEYSQFIKFSKQELHGLYDLLDNSSFEGDFDLINDILYIYSKDGDFVINQHSPSSQIWLSSPISGTGYFNYDDYSKKWQDKKGQSLANRLIEDLKL